MRYGPLQQIWFHAISHCDKLGYALWASEQNEAAQKNLFWFLRMGHKAKFGNVLWAITQGLFMHYGSYRQTKCHTANYTTVFYSKSLLYLLKDSDA
jgi:hypothetical protein